MEKPNILFLIIDIQQIGQTNSLLSRSDIPLQQSNVEIIIVVQSVNDLKESNTIAEALFELSKSAKVLNFKIKGVLVNSDQTHYSILANWLVIQSNQFKTIKDETMFLNSLDEQDRNEAGEIIRSWKSLV